MKNVYLFQIPSTFDNNSPVYFPYSVGLLWSYAQQFDTIQKHYSLKEIIFLRENPDEILKRMVNPKIVGLSCYVWNMNYNMSIAKQIKQKFPDCKIIAGGPHVPVKDDNFFYDHPYIDITIYREGELSFKEVLESIAENTDLENVSGIGINRNKQLIRTSNAQRTQNLDDIPSPYLLGLFDGMKEHCDDLGLTINGLIETNRGCPYKCTFCDWGNGALGKVKKFDLSRVKKELLWFAKNRVEYIVNCDANFGIFKERDLEITVFMTKLKRRYGYPETFDTNWPKDNNSKSVEIAKLMLDNNMLRRFTASIQSQNPNTLSAIKRKNLPGTKVKEIIDYARDNNIDTNVELIIGLPMDTYENFQRDFVELVEQGAYPSTSFLTILPNSEMADENYRQKYGFVTKINPKNLLYVKEKDELVIATNTMTKDKVEKLMLWCWFIQQFHFLGYTNVIADFFFKRYNVGLLDFYDEFIDKVCEDSDQYPNKEISPLKNHIDNNLSIKLDIGIVNIDMHTRLGNQYRQDTFKGIEKIIQQMLPDEESQLIKDLVCLQNYSQFDCNRDKKSKINLNYNILEYIYYDHQLTNKKYSYIVSQPQSTPKNYGEFLVRSRFSRGWKNAIDLQSEEISI